MMSIIFTAGTTWVLVASETQQSMEQRQQYLRYAGKCVNHLEHAERLWESASQLRVMLARLLAEQQTKIRLGDVSSNPNDPSGAESSVSAGSTRKSTPAREETDRPSAHNQETSSNPPPAGPFTNEQRFGSQAEHHFANPQVSRFDPHAYNPPLRYPPPSSFVHWAHNSQASSSNPMGGSASHPTYAFNPSDPPHLPPHGPIGPQDWSVDPQFWMSEVGENIQLPSGFFPPQASGSGSQPHPGHGPAF